MAVRKPNELRQLVYKNVYAKIDACRRDPNDSTQPNPDFPIPLLDEDGDVIDLNEFIGVDNMEFARQGDDMRPYIFCYVRHENSDQIAFGGPGCDLFEESGVVYIEINVPADTNTKVADEIGEHLKSVFDYTRIDTVRFENSVARELGYDDDEKWYIVTVTAEFIYERQR